METGFWTVSERARTWIGEVADLKRFEEAIVLRRRLGKDIKQVANDTGIPSWVLGKFEEGEQLPTRVHELRSYVAWLERQEPETV